MTYPTQHPTMIEKLTAEFLGTFVLMLTVGCNVLGSSSVWGGVSIACALMVMVYALGNISGANFNPAVSLALGITKVLGGPGMNWWDVGAYAAVQAAAGVSAALSCSLLLKGSFKGFEPAPGFGWGSAALCEMSYTCMLCFIVLNVTASRQRVHEKRQYYGLAIGFVIVAAAYSAGPVSGGCFNPAVALGMESPSLLQGFGWCLVYIVFELLGALLAALLFVLVRPEDFGLETGTLTCFLSEFLGTFVLVLTVGLNVLGKSPASAFSISAALMSMIYALSDVSGGHFNPAVTVAVLASGRSDLSISGAACYAVAQLIGGIGAGISYAAVFHDSFPLGPVGESFWSQACVAELVFSFLLSFVVLCVALSPRTKSSQMFGLAVGSCVTVGGLAVGSISGASLNPAVSFGISAAHITTIDTKLFPTLSAIQLVKSCIYSAVELAGGLAAAGIFRITHYSDLVELECKGFS